jgi:hypothetical protein
MIVVRLMGGLGNQMFQYALGRHLSVKASTGLKLDHSLLPRAETPYRYELREYHVAAEQASAADVRRLSEHYPRPPAGLVRRALHHWRFGSRRTHIVERTLEFDPDVLSLGTDVMLEGYWQSPKYFEPIEDLIRDDLRLRLPLPERASAQAAALRAEESVCIHVRRGDYVHNPGAAAMHGLCGPDYYDQATRWIAERIPGAKFHVFSNDIDWVRSEFRLPVAFSAVEPTLDRPQVDLSLMSSCRHFVIANSSYSWWAAWLSAADRKTVIAPRKWGIAAALNTVSRFPSGWIVL